jgi:hypothetical protein
MSAVTLRINLPALSMPMTADHGSSEFLIIFKVTIILQHLGGDYQRGSKWCRDFQQHTYRVFSSAVSRLTSGFQNPATLGMVRNRHSRKP